MSVSPQIRVVALVGILAALGLAAGMMALGRGQSASSAPPKVIKPLHPVRKQHPKAARAKHAKPAAPARKPTAKPAAKPAVAGNGLPAALASALTAHDVVVVSLYAPDAAVDQEALKEAQAGASLAGAGFVALNVRNESEAGPLAELLNGVLEDPAVLVFQRAQPKSVFVRINGFADRETVAQAAVNAAP